MWSLIIISILIVVSAVGAFDFIVYVIKSAPKSQVLNQLFWKVSFLSSMAVVYWLLNGFSF